MKKKKDLINAKKEYNKLYYLYVNTLVGKLIKKGNRFSALKIYKKLRESIKIRINKEKNISFIFFFAMLNSMPKVSFKEIRLGSQKKDVPFLLIKKNRY